MNRNDKPVELDIEISPNYHGGTNNGRITYTVKYQSGRVSKIPFMLIGKDAPIPHEIMTIAELILTGDHSYIEIGEPDVVVNATPDIVNTLTGVKP